MSDFTHLDKNDRPTMVDVSGKPVSTRTASAAGIVTLGTEILAQLQGNDWHSKKGSIIDTAIIAVTMAAKKTSELIPFCHPIALRSIKINIKAINEAQLEIQSSVKVEDQTGVEMEALTAVSVAALTIYDMCKALSHEIRITDIRLIEKTGGTSGDVHLS
jgi:cyclic pyranopterin monophosphate synthase